jgi:hypothetical protein
VHREKSQDKHNANEFKQLRSDKRVNRSASVYVCHTANASGVEERRRWPAERLAIVCLDDWPCHILCV